MHHRTLSARQAVRLSTACLLALTAIAGLLAPRVAQALPASCSTAGNQCIAPEITPWVYYVDPGFGNPDIGPFDSEGAALAAIEARLAGNWCSATVTGVTYDSNTYRGTTPAFDGSIDVHHGNYIQVTVTSRPYAGAPCSQSWVYYAGLFQDRKVYCLDGWSKIYDSSVTPKVPFCQTSSGTYQPAKAPGQMCPATNVVKGNPCDVTNQNKQQIEVDYQGAGSNPLKFARAYNSAPAKAGISNLLDTFGVGWTATYFQRLFYSSVSVGGTPHATIFAFRPTGEVLNFNLVGGQWVRVGDDISDTLTSIVGGGYEYRTANNRIETYDASGRLLSIQAPGTPQQTLTYSGSSPLPSSVSTPFGHSLTFGYTTIQDKPRLTSVTDPAGALITYTYVLTGSARRLSSVTYPDSTSRLYDSTAGWNLQSITDEAGVVYASWVYGYYGITESQHAGGVERYQFSYNLSNAKVSVTDPLNILRTYGFTVKWGVRRATTANGTCAGCQEYKTRSYDANGNLATRTDFNNNQTNYTFDPTRNLETARTEAFGTAKARTISTTWHSTWRSPATITEPNRIRTFTYDSNGNVLTRTVTDTSVTPNVSRVWTYTYDSDNRLLTEDGSRTDINDVTSYNYYTCTMGYQCGQLQSTTNALGHTTTYDSYNAHGQPTQITDANGLVTTLAYDLRRRLTDRCVGGTLPGCSGGELTHLDYWPTGLLKKVTNPDASYIEYTYDAAHRLTQINDGALNKVVYTLDNMSNRTAENTYDPSNALRRTHSRVFNTLNQLWKDVNAAGTAAVTTTFGYDTNGNQTSVAAPLARNSSSLYDELNRLKRITDPASGITLFGYDAQDNLTSVTDPRSLITSYGYNGFGDLLTQTSPDTGLTTNTYDSAGNLDTSTDSRGAVSDYSYDAVNRVTSVSFTLGGVTDQTISYGYDAGTNQNGRLTSASDADHTLAFTYDTHGRVTGKGQTVGGVTLAMGYGYDAAGRLGNVQLPSGNTVTFGYNANGQVSSVSLNGGTTILSGVTYDPFGPITGWTWGNGTTASRGFDTDGKITQVDNANGASLKNYSYDDAFRITGISDALDPTLSWTYGYDSLDRLNSASKTGASQGWTYDGNGNRLTETGSTPSTYTNSTTSNRLSSTSGTLSRSYSYDNAGNTLSYGTATFTYNNRGRMKTASNAGTTATYTYNALGQRIRRATSSLTTLYVYDEAGHLAGEYTAAGALVQETVWLGDIPVATVRPNGAGGVILYYVHTDHLNTPRLVTDTANNIRWTWDSDAFGATPPNQNPSGLGTFEYNLRFPGQQYDAVVGLHYNYFRDYDPAVGRYVESDPIGLHGGYNTYAYTFGNPVMLLDAAGLRVELRCRRIGEVNKTDSNQPILSSMAAALGGEHCFIVVSCETPIKIPETIISYPKSARENDAVYSYIERYRTVPVIPPPSAWKPCGASCEFEKCVADSAADLDRQGYYMNNYDAVKGPNSNSYARRLIEKCGGTVMGSGPPTGWDSAGKTGF